MALRRGSSTARSQGGFALIEVVVSALIMVTVTGGVIKLISATGKTGADQRNRAQAYAVAQEDQARMRGMQISSLNRYERKEEPVKVGKVTYEVTSRAYFVNDETAEASCEAGNNTADYVRISSEVDWEGRSTALKAVRIESIVSPATGSLDPTHGTLAIEALNATGQKISAVGLAGSGPQSFNGSTDSTGCALFPDLPEGNYTLTPSLAAGYVDEVGKAPAPIANVGVVRNGTVTKVLRFDLEGKIALSPTVRGYTGSTIASSTSSAMLINTMWSKGGQEKTVTPSTGSPQLISGLYPFGSISQYSVYAGACSANKPSASGASASVSVNSNQTVPASIQMHPIYPTVWTGRNSSNKGSGFANAEVWVDDDNCSATHVRTTNSSGQLSNPGFPWSRYDVCADSVVGSSSGSRRQRIDNVEAKSLTSGAALNFYLGSGTSSASESGNCP